VPSPKKPNRQVYKDSYAEQAKKACEAGFTDRELADLFSVDERTIQRWKLSHPEFGQALTVGKAPADDRVERSLYHKAIGFQHKAVKIFPPARGGDGEPLLVEYVEHVPPDTVACIFWLKNRRPAEWRDKHDVEHAVKREPQTLDQLREEILHDIRELGILPESMLPPKLLAPPEGVANRLRNDEIED